MELTKAEQKFIDDLQKLAKRCPKTLWLFAGDGKLCVMKYGSDGKPVESSSGGVSSEAVVATIDSIHADGGGW